MRVDGIALSVLILASTTFLGYATDNPVPISQSDKLHLDAADYREHLHSQEIPLSTLRRLASDQAAQREFLLDVHSDIALVHEAEALGLADNIKVQRKLERARKKVMIDALMEQQRQTLEYPDFAVLARERYQANPQQYRLPEKRKVAHILIERTWNCGAIPQPRSPKQTAARVTEIMQALEEGMDFAALAAEYSDDPNNAQKGGLVNIWVEREKSRFAPGFVEAVFQIGKVGGIGQGETKYGLHIIQLVELEPSKQLSFEQVKDHIIAQLKTKYRNSALEQTRSDAYPDLETLDLKALSQVIAAYLQDLEEASASQ